MAPLDVRFIGLFIDKVKLLELVKPMFSKKIPCFAPLEHHLFDRIWVLKTYEELNKMRKAIKESIPKNVINFEDRVALERYLSVKFSDLCNILLTSFYDVFNTVNLVICFNDFLLENDLFSCMWLMFSIMEVLLSMYPFATINIPSFDDCDLDGDSWRIHKCKIILFNPRMENIQVAFNSIQYIDSFNYDNTEYVITQKMERACDDYNLLEITAAIKELSKFYGNRRDVKTEKNLNSNQNEIIAFKNKENNVEKEEEGKQQFRLPKWLYEKVFNGPRQETKPQKYQSYHGHNAKMINHQVRVAQFLELNKKFHGRTDPKFQKISEIELKFLKSSLLCPKKILGIKITRNHKLLFSPN